MFYSDFEKRGEIRFPEFSGTRVMMMPFHLHDLSTLPETLGHYRDVVQALVSVAREKRGTAYLTIDEKDVAAGACHRRPGLHVDGVGPDGSIAGWGGGGGWGQKGMLVASSVEGCVAYKQLFDGWPNVNGDCEYLRDKAANARLLSRNTVYEFSGLTVHESLPMPVDTRRVFVRLSMPSSAPWYEGYTVNPKVAPEGPIHPQRPSAFMRGENE